MPEQTLSPRWAPALRSLCLAGVLAAAAPWACGEVPKLYEGADLAQGAKLIADNRCDACHQKSATAREYALTMVPEILVCAFNAYGAYGGRRAARSPRDRDRGRGTPAGGPASTEQYHAPGLPPPSPLPLPPASAPASDPATAK